MKYRVRQGFYVHLGEDNIASSGDVIDLTPDKFQRYAHQLELVEQLKQQESKRESKVQS